MSVPARSDAAVSVDGIIDLPPGKIATVATFLEMRRPDAPTPPQGAGSFVPLADDLARYRRLYASVGERWLWFSRSLLSDMRLRTIIADPDVEALALVRDRRDVGLLELDFRQAGECEVSFLGLVPDAIGQGLGRVLVGEATRRGFARGVERLWLHTCTLDHPGALGFYMAMGFRPFRRAVEIADDPRLSGHLPRSAAPGLPIV